MSVHRRSPRPIALGLHDVRNGLAPDTLLGDVQRIWPEAVGPAIAAQATPASERSGVLTVACTASVWAHELDLISATLLERVNARIRRGRIERLRCVAVQLRDEHG